MRAFRRNFAMKRISVLLVTAALIICSLYIGAYASDTTEYDMLPVVYVSGFGATTLSLVGEDGTSDPVFPPQSDEIKRAVDGMIFPTLSGLTKYILRKDFNDLANALLEIVDRIFVPLTMNADGTSFYNIVPVVSGAENTSLKAFRDSDKLSLVPYTGSKFLDMELVGDIVGDENVYNFTYDWRLSHVDNAELFREYIIDVMRLSHSSKVNVYSISQGSLIVGAYMYKYAQDGFLNNVVFDTPVLSGSELVSDLFSLGDVKLNYSVVADILSEILHTETDFKGIIGALPEDTLNFVFDYGLKHLALTKVIWAPAFWDMVPSDKIDALLDYWLDSEESASVIDKVSQMHNGFMAHISETFALAESYGAVISIKSCTGSPLASGTVDNSDGIVNVRYSCGAATSALGESFDDSYIQQSPNAAYSVSPDRTVDLSCGYYPERTWIINNHYHGQIEWDENSLQLVMKLLLTKDGIPDAHSSYYFPQFMETVAPNADISAFFACTNCCFLPYSDGQFSGDSLVIKNLSTESSMIIRDLSFVDGSLTVDADLPFVLRPGESATLDVSGSVPVERAYDTLFVSYISSDKLFSEEEISFGVTLLNDYAGVIQHDELYCSDMSAVTLFINRYVISAICAVISFFGHISGIDALY